MRIDKQITFGRYNLPANVEIYDSSMEVVELLKKRSITDESFEDMTDSDTISSGNEFASMFGDEGGSNRNWYGVNSYNEALRLLNNGWDGPVNKINALIKSLTMTTERKRYKYFNDVQGFAPVVPLALIGVPNCMRNMSRTPIKSKVIDVMYNNELLCDKTPEEFEKAGLEMFKTIVELEQSGYRINLWVIQAYYDGPMSDEEGYEDEMDMDLSNSGHGSADVLAVKIKDAGQPLDAKRIAFPVMHTAMFRVISFDWYSRYPKGTYRGGYGYLCPLVDLEDLVKKITGNNTTYIVRADDILSNIDKPGYTKDLLLQSEKVKNPKKK